MNEDDLMKIAESIESKIGAENSASIADDLGQLITKNSETLKAMSDLNDKISDLQSRNDKLVAANGNLLRQIPMAEDKPIMRGEPQEEEPRKSISLKSCFDKHGNFRK